MILDIDRRTLTLNGNLPAVGSNFSEQAESELIERLRAGDAEAFGALYRKHYAQIVRFTIYLMGDQSKAEELTQDVFVWLVKHPNAYESKLGSLPAFLKGVARNLLRRQLRQERRWHSLDELMSREQLAHEFLTSQNELSTEIDAGLLRKAIGKLALKYREAIVLCDLEGQSYEEAAGVLRCPVGTVRSRLHRARRLLTEQFTRDSRRGG
jgi:RNA polymerase sigma-70 factor (ECF subfamily)